MAYFDSFPLGTYSNTQVVDITRRVSLRRSLVSDPRVYLPYTLSDGERADSVATHYYSDANNVWMVYMSAGLVDPYHEWLLSQSDFDQHIIAKYGSQERAIELTHCWQLDWASDETELTVAGYTSLDDTLKKYWEAVYGVGSNILSYTRRQEDWTASTNMVVKLTVTPQSNAAVSVGDVVDVYSGPTLSGQAEVSWANSTTVQVTQVQANVAVGQSIKTDGGANLLVTDLVWVSNTIPIDERPYWSRVSKYDYEQAKNEGRKFIRLVDRKYTVAMSTELKKKLGK